jgi:tripartite ATP-independent transporter DctP family solute receptor
MRRTIAAVLIAGVTLTAAHEAASQTVKTVVLRVAHTAAPDEPYQAAFAEFGAAVEKATGGSLKVEVFPNGQLGDEGSVLKSVQSGAIAIATVSNSVLADFSETLHLFDLPFLFRDRSQAYAVLDGPIGEGMAAPLAAKGFVLLGYYEAGVRNILNSQHPITSLADFKNMKIRVVPSTINLDTFRALGANPVPLQYSQLYVALQTHVVDAAEAANSNYDAKKFYEVAPFYAVIRWQIQVAPIVMSKRIFDSLSPEQQAAIRSAAAEAVKTERLAYQKADVDTMKDLLAHDVKVTEPDPKPWVDAVGSVWAKWESVVGKTAIDAAVATK